MTTSPRHPAQQGTGIARLHEDEGAMVPADRRAIEFGDGGAITGSVLNLTCGHVTD